jgi:molybdopterin biosynthesis enzyme
MGYNLHQLSVNLPMETSFTRKSADKLALVPVIITDDGSALPVEYHGSAHISSLAQAEGIITIPVGKTTIEKGEVVSVRQI